MEHFALLSAKGATVISDYVSILLNISGLRLIFSEESHHVDDICFLAVVLALATGDVSGFCNDGKQLMLGNRQSTRSWACWPSGMRHPRQRPFTVDVKHSIKVSHESLKLGLYILERHEVHPPESLKQNAEHLLKSEKGLILLSLRKIRCLCERLRGSISGSTPDRSRFHCSLGRK